MDLLSNYGVIMQNARLAAERASRRIPQLLAVSKFQEVSQMQLLAEHIIAQGGKAVFGESYVQEYRKKKPQLPPHKAHMIGRMQRNKAREAVELFDVIESVHSLPLADAIQKEAERCNKVQEIFLQINISDDEGKAGFDALELPQVVQELMTRANLKILGLMTITRDYERREDVRPDFIKMRKLFEQTAEQFPQLHITELSMGMSADYDIATEEGASIIRVGSALFGERKY